MLTSLTVTAACNNRALTVYVLRPSSAARGGEDNGCCKRSLHHPSLYFVLEIGSLFDRRCLSLPIEAAEGRCMAFR